MANCPRCGKPVKLLAKLCDQCKMEIAAEETRKQNEARLQTQMEQARAEEQRKLILQEAVSSKKAEIKNRLTKGHRIFLYDSLYLPVDSVLLKENLNVNFDIAPLKDLGLAGWEIINAIPRTIGIGLENVSHGSTSGTSWGGGSGGNVVGVHIIIQKELTLDNLDDNEVELDHYIETHLMEISSI